MRFFRCKHCGKIIAIVNDRPVPTICCGEAMEEIVANTEEAAHEKHIPVVKVEGNIVRVEVGSVLHPMLEAHYIEWIALETKNGNQSVQYDDPQKRRIHPQGSGESEHLCVRCNPL